MERKIKPTFFVLLVGLLLAALICGISPAKAGEMFPQALYGKTGRHQVTGKVVSVDREKGVFVVQGRRKTLRFEMSGAASGDLSPGERVRVRYKVTPEKKVVVLKVKKVNNGNAPGRKSFSAGRKRIED